MGRYKQGLRPLGYAVLVEDEDGNRMVIYSDDVEEAEMMLTYAPPIAFGSDGPIGEPTMNYDLSLRGRHFNIQKNVEPLTNILEGEHHQIEAK